MTTGGRLFCLMALVMASTQPAARAQNPYRVTSGGYLHVLVESTPENYSAGYSFYSAAWPLLGDYPRDNSVQSGLYGTWMSPLKTVSNTHYTTIEGGLGWWSDRNFQTATPKFIMGGVSMGNETWTFANTPGSGSGGGNGKYGIAQLSPSLLIPPDGLNLRQGTSGQLFGYGYLALPLTEPKITTAGTALATGNHCWTLFMNSSNYKGPAAFFTPYFWSQTALLHPEWAGQTFDTRWAEANKGFAMESQAAMRSVAFTATDATYIRAIPAYYPVDANGYSLLMHRPSVYDQGALWNEVGQWLGANGPAPRGLINPNSTYLQTAVAYNPSMSVLGAAGNLGPLDWSGVVSPYAPNSQEFGYKWKTEHPSLATVAGGARIRLPEYYKGPVSPNSTSLWLPIESANVPQSAATALSAVSLAEPKGHASIVLKTSDPVWTSPGPASVPYHALLGDGSFVTYYWYRFADQPAILKGDMTVAERDRLQTVVEKMHRDWKNDRDYIAPPTAGSLADLDAGQLVTPPLGFEYGYVPIAWRQDWGGSVASPGSVSITAAPATASPGTPFSVTLRANNASGVAQNVTSNTHVQLSLASGYGTLSGTFAGTIPSGSSSVTISGIVYSAADTMTLAASTTCLSPGTSTNISFTNLNGIVNLYNRPATGVLATSAMLNATLDCRGTDAEVKVYWGIYNGGITPAGWANSASLGTSVNLTSLDLSNVVTGLLPKTMYYYTFCGINTAGLNWASKVLNFTTLPLPPSITTQPSSRSSVVGSTARFTVVAPEATGYQWFKGAVPLADGGQITGANSAMLSLNGVTVSNIGTYSVVVTNTGGSTTSASVTLSILAISNLTWDANGTIANVTDGAGQWISNSWWNGTANVSWIDDNNVQIGAGGTGGDISLSEVMVNNLTLSNFSGNYTLRDGTISVRGSLTVDSPNTVRLSSSITGAGSLTKNGTGTVTLDGVIPNFYDGGTVINSGTLAWGVMVGGSSPPCNSACGTGPVTLNSNGTIIFQRANINNALTLNGGNLLASNGWGASWSGPVTVNSNTFVRPESNIVILGNISGPGGFTKTAAGELRFGGRNTYRGATVLQAGQISWQEVYSMSSGHLIVSNGAMANLRFSGTRTIENLTLGGVAMVNGTYGSIASPATNKNNTYFSGTGVVNVVGGNIAPVAVGQSVTTVMNQTIPINLTGTDENGNPLSFSIATQPTSGFLTSSGANFSYTPATDFVGVASFTFRANDGFLDSIPATVIITIQPKVFIWEKAVSGNWSDNAMWLGGGPVNGADSLNFNVSGVYTSTSDLAANTQLNRLNFGGSTVTLTGGGLTLVASDNVQPTINQNSGVEVMIHNLLNFANNTIFAGVGTGNVVVSELISGSGGLTKNTPGMLKLYGLSPNIYSGGTVVNSGTLHLGTTLVSGTSPLCINPAGSGSITLNNGATIEFDRVSATNSLIINSGMLFTPNGWGAALSGPVTINSNLNCNTPYQLVISGTMSGPGELLKSGGGPLVLSGNSS